MANSHVRPTRRNSRSDAVGRCELARQEDNGRRVDGAAACVTSCVSESTGNTSVSQSFDACTRAPCFLRGTHATRPAHDDDIRSKRHVHYRPATVAYLVRALLD